MSWNFQEISWNFQEISWKSQEISWKFQEIYWNFQEISWNFQEISWKPGEIDSSEPPGPLSTFQDPPKPSEKDNPANGPSLGAPKREIGNK